MSPRIPRTLGALSIVLVLGVVTVAPADNQLANETSPYLRMHAHNPVNWYPWGAEAFAKAQRENKVIFLSVGYSSCYWCHVMERESFMDEEIAQFLNDHFVCVKVDREERADVDEIYMLAVQIKTGRGGWPMSEFLTPETKPFFGGTYFPARDGDRGPTTGFLSLIRTIDQVWQEKEQDLRERADQVTEAIQLNLDTSETSAAPVVLEASFLDTMQRELTQEYDPQYGGFGFDAGQPNRPKFPEPSNLLFLLDRARAGDARAHKMVQVTLEKMHAGGIWDHVGGGFHRYSVDRFWHIPHFEKMLYDNGQLAVVYTQAFELDPRPEYRQVIERLLDFVLREMRDPQGGFYSALDAESEKVEGKYYRWERAEVERLLGDDYAFYASVYGLDGPPNFEEQFYVPELREPWARLAEKETTTEERLWARLGPLHAKLLAARNQRPRPLTDTKILAAWNGLMIRGFADAGRVLQRPDYVQVATDAAQFVLTRMRREDGRLYRTHTDNVAKLNAYLDDYACLCDGLLALHKATGNATWLETADELTALQIRHYGDPIHGGFYFTSDDHESLIARGKQPADGATPAGNSVAAQNLIYLARERNKPDYLEWARRTVASVAPKLQSTPRIAPRMALALAELLELANR